MGQRQKWYRHILRLCYELSRCCDVPASEWHFLRHASCSFWISITAASSKPDCSSPTQPLTTSQIQDLDIICRVSLEGPRTLESSELLHSYQRERKKYSIYRQASFRFLSEAMHTRGQWAPQELVVFNPPQVVFNPPEGSA